MKIVIASGGFDPLHAGHIQYLNEASFLGDILIVGVNSDAWLINKKGNYFLPWHERSYLVQHLRMVSGVRAFDDRDGTALDLLRQVRAEFPDYPLIVANGGDRTALNNAEAAFDDLNCEFVFGVGGTQKVNASSAILKRWKELS
jgi:cytidyltransferase-like protein